MKFNRNAKGISFFGMKFDGWEVLLAGGIACIIAGTQFSQAHTLLMWLGIALVVLWVIAVIVVNTRSRRPAQPTQGGGAAPVDHNPSDRQSK
jgi:cytochrome b561